MIPFKSGEFTFELPSKWADLTLKQFYALRDSDGKAITAASILSGIPVSEFAKSDDVFILEKIYPFLTFLDDKFDLENYFIPDFITIDGVKYPKPKELGVNTAGQKWHLEDAYREIVEKDKSEVDIYPLALAIYMQPIVTGKQYDADLVDELVPKIMDCKLIEAWPLASFFLTSYAKQLNLKERTLVMSQHQKNYEQALIGLQNSETFQQYSLWRKLWVKALTKLFKRIGTRYTQHYYTSMKLADTKGV